MSVIKISGLRKQYEPGLLVFDGAEFELEEGGFYGVIGQSGAGKSTLLNILGCLDNDYSGDYLCSVRGKDFSISANKKHFAKAEVRASMFSFVFQSPTLLDYLDVFENVVLSLVYSGIHFSEAKVDETLADLGIKQYKWTKTTHLSGGERQRVEIARAILSDAPIILADEPTGSLDYVSTKKVMDLLQLESKKHGKTTIVATHNLDLLDRFDGILEIKNGKISTPLPQRDQTFIRG